MKNYFTIVLLLTSTIIANSIVYYFNDPDADSGYILKEIENIQYLGLYNDELLIFKIQQTSNAAIPNDLLESFNKKIYSIKKKKVNIVNYSSKQNYRSIIYSNIDNKMFIDYLKTDYPLSDPLYIIPEPIIIEPKEEIKEEKPIDNKEAVKPIKKVIMESSHFTLGYSLKQNMSILNHNYDMLSNFTCGYLWLGDSGKNKKIDVGFEYSPKIKKSYYGNKFLEISLFDLYFHWRLPPFTNNLQSYIKLGVSHILDFKIWGDSFKSEFSFDLTKQPDGGIFYGIGLLKNKKLSLSVVQYNLFINDSYNIYQPQNNNVLAPFEPGEIITDPEIDILKINISRLF